MTLKIKIGQKITDYYQHGSRRTAYQLACLYLCLSRAVETEEEMDNLMIPAG